MSHGCQRPALLQVYRGKAKYSIHHESWVFLIARLDLVAKVLISSYVTFTWIFVQNEAVAVGISTLDHSMACLTQDPGLPGSFLWGPWATSDRKSIHHPSSNLWSCFIWKVHKTLTKNSWVPTTRCNFGGINGINSQPSLPLLVGTKSLSQCTEHHLSVASPPRWRRAAVTHNAGEL